MTYTVHTSDVLDRAEDHIHHGGFPTRAAAQSRAADLVRAGVAHSIDVRLDGIALLDRYVRRGTSARHVYAATQRQRNSVSSDAEPQRTE